MKSLLTKWLKSNNFDERLPDEELYKKEVESLYLLLTNFYGTDKLVLKASKLDALALMRSDLLGEQTAALLKIVTDDPTPRSIPTLEEIPELLNEAEERIVDLIVRRSVEDRLDRQINDRMQKRQQEYWKEIKLQVLKEYSGPENAQTLKKLGALEQMKQVHLAKPVEEVLRPVHPDEIIGQTEGMQSLLAKLSTPYPQHVLIFGPPGVGKTTAARVALATVKNKADSLFAPDAPFIEVDGTTLRWDPRDVTNPLLGSVHDPIYQGAKRDLADIGIPEPKLGLVSDANGGVLFIDEIGEMDTLLLNKLLKVLEDKKVQFDSSYYDPEDPQIPQYIKQLFEEGAPADFILIGATTRDPRELNPALRSRCAEVYFVPLEPQDICRIVRQTAAKLEIELVESVPEIISNYVIDGRKANMILTDAYGLACYQEDQPAAGKVRISAEIIYEVLRAERLVPYVTRKIQSGQGIGRTLGLGVAGFLGSVLEIEAVVFPAVAGKGRVRFNETAGSMARDAVFNATAVIRRLSGEDLRNYDVHVNVIGGGKIDGPSAGVAMTLAIYSALKNQPVYLDVAMTGEVSISGEVKPVGGIYEKIFGAKQAGARKVIIPAENLAEVPSGLSGIEVVAVEHIEQAMKHLCV
ncbi:MAG: Lon family ATP-dependent protease [Peptococcaceae bacterium]|jgi:ATP-dependent Lon protease|nr:Lon family ATP-dependent protease [Peptococcaceae bacterium]